MFVHRLLNFIQRYQCSTHPPVRERVKEAEARREGALRAQLELAAFDDTPTNTDEGKALWARVVVQTLQVRYQGTRASFITLKPLDRRDHPHEIDITQYFSSKTLVTSVNPCVPVYDPLSIPDEDKAIAVMPLLREHTHPLVRGGMCWTFI